MIHFSGLDDPVTKKPLSDKYLEIPTWKQYDVLHNEPLVRGRLLQRASFPDPRFQPYCCTDVSWSSYEVVACSQTGPSNPFFFSVFLLRWLLVAR